jgi:hypothetical protein
MSSTSPNPQTNQEGRRTTQRCRRVVYSLIVLAFAYAIIELFASVLLYVRWGGYSATRDALGQAVAGGIEATVDSRFEVVHPYLGYVMHIDNADYTVQGTRPFAVTDYGLYDAAPPIRSRSPDKVLPCQWTPRRIRI